MVVAMGSGAVVAVCVGCVCVCVGGVVGGRWRWGWKKGERLGRRRVRVADGVGNMGVCGHGGCMWWSGNGGQVGGCGRWWWWWMVGLRVCGRGEARVAGGRTLVGGWRRFGPMACACVCVMGR